MARILANSPLSAFGTSIHAIAGKELQQSAIILPGLCLVASLHARRATPSQPKLIHPVRYM